MNKHIFAKIMGDPVPKEDTGTCKYKTLYEQALNDYHNVCDQFEKDTQELKQLRIANENLRKSSKNTRLSSTLSRHLSDRRLSRSEVLGMTCREKLAIDHPERVGNEWAGGCFGCPSDYRYLPDLDYCIAGGYEPRDEICTKCWDREIPEDEDKVKKVIDETFAAYDNFAKVASESPFVFSPQILDSGNRRQFETGAVRDIQEGKGRCDLMPLDVVVDYLDNATGCGYNMVLARINRFIETGKLYNLHHAVAIFTEQHWENDHTMLLEVAKHFEEGAKKYGENNWQKGIPVHCYIDSAVRHYLKFLRGDKDEPHDRAFCWNILCAIWTCKHKPELNEYRKDEENVSAT